MELERLGSGPKVRKTSLKIPLTFITMLISKTWSGAFINSSPSYSLHVFAKVLKLFEG